MARKPRTIAEKAEAAYRADVLFEKQLSQMTTWRSVRAFIDRGPSGSAPGAATITRLAALWRFGYRGEGVGDRLWDDLVARLGRPPPWEGD